MKRSFLFLLLALWIRAGLGSEPAPSPPAKPPNPSQLVGERFLFIVDTSASMRRLEHDGRQALFDMIYTGLDGYAKPGDTYGVWTFNEEVDAGRFPMQVWATNDLLRLASQATLFVKDQDYHGRKKCLDKVLLAIGSVVRMAKDVNIFIISDENAQVKGTPFDALVNELYEKLSSQVLTSGQPIVTSFVARHGELVNAAVTLAGEPIFLPPRPEPPAPAQTNDLSAAAAKPEPSSPRKNPPRNIIITRQQDNDRREIPPPPPDRTAQELTTSSAVSSPSLDASKKPLADASPQAISDKPSPVDPLPDLPGQPAATPNSASLAATPPSPSDPAADKELDAPSSWPALPPTGARLHPQPMPVAAREPSSPASAAPLPGDDATVRRASLVASSVPNKTDAVLWLVGGLTLLLLAIGLAALFWKLHRNAQQPSIITQSMYRK